MKHLLTLNDLDPASILRILDRADLMKKDPAAFSTAMAGRSLLMVFEKPSLRTRVSFESGFARMGGHPIYYDLSRSPLGAGKETLSDMAQVFSRYVNVVMARLFEHAHLEEICAHATVPVINALTNFSHPCQILADFQTIREKKGTLEGLTLCYLGDANNNVTHSLMMGCAQVGLKMRIGCPAGDAYEPSPDVLALAPAVVTTDADEAVAGADIVYADTWMSYHISKDELAQRKADLLPTQVTAARMALANPDAIFMNCLPAMRGAEQTAEVIDGPQSVVFDQAENRMWAQNSLMVELLDG